MWAQDKGSGCADLANQFTVMLALKKSTPPGADQEWASFKSSLINSDIKNFFTPGTEQRCLFFCAGYWLRVTKRQEDRVAMPLK
jgi:hypothetical protein